MYRGIRNPTEEPEGNLTGAKQITIKSTNKIKQNAL